MVRNEAQIQGSSCGIGPSELVDKTLNLLEMTYHNTEVFSKNELYTHLFF